MAEPSRSLSQVAAWKIGRLLNQLRFENSRAWLLCRADCLPAAEEVYRQLRLAVRQLGLDPRNEGSVLDQLARKRQSWLDAFHSEWHAEEWNTAKQQFAKEQESGVDTAGHACERFLQTTDGTSQAMSAAIESSLPEPPVRIVRLGALVDWGARPQDTLILVPGTPWWLEDEIDSEAIKKSGWQFLPSESDATKTAMEMDQAKTRITEGKYAAKAQAWLQEVRQAWDQAGMKADICSLMLTPPRTPAQSVAIVDKLDEQARNELAANDSKMANRVQVAVTREPPQVTINNTVYPLRNPIDAVFVQALLDAHGEWFGPADTKAALFKYPELKGVRADRIYKRLPEQVKMLIDIEPGHGCRIDLQRLA